MIQILDVLAWLFGWVVVLILFGWWFYINRGRDDGSDALSVAEVVETKSLLQWPLDVRAKKIADTAASGRTPYN